MILGATRICERGATGQGRLARGGKPRQILGVLASRLGEPRSKDELAEILWPDGAPNSALASLESYVCVLRRQLGEVGPYGRSALVTMPRGYLLDPEHVRVDLCEARTLLARARQAEGALKVDLTARALVWVQGPLLASEPYDAWAEAARGAFHQELVHACVTAAETAWELARHDEAVELAHRAIAVDRLVEPAWAVMMRGLVGLGRAGEALRCYGELRELLADELGVAPGPEVQATYSDVLRARQVPLSGDAASEVRTLLTLLRQALENVPGARIPEQDRWLSVVAVDAVSGL